MPLRRGRVRESCGFCHRRKVRCDRSERIAVGKHSCSACSLRSQPCKLNHDLHQQRARSSSALDNSVSLSDEVPDQARVFAGVTSLERLHEPSPQVTSDTIETPIGRSSNQSVDCNLQHDSAFDDFLYLSMPSVALLDDIFLGDCGTDEQFHASDFHSESLAIPLALHEDVSDQAPVHQVEAQQTHNGDETTDPDAHMVEAAIRAYFKHVAPMLPVLPQRAFWIDYGKGLSCEALKLALACRGYPFINVDNKLHLQQTAASDFRRTFLENRADSPQSPVVRIDELEALALMIDFKYEESYLDPNESRFAQLFLSSDSLVLYTLQLEHNLNEIESQEPEARLSSLRERCTTLFWHVFSLDAFNCLEQLRPSRIQDLHILDTPGLPTMTARDYLDSVLSLAIEARVISKTIRSDCAGQVLMTIKSLSKMYERLQTWREHLDKGPLIWVQEERSDDRLGNAHSFMLAMLELNCYMQIEHHALRARYRNRSARSSLEQEIMACKIELETLMAICRTFRTPRWKKIISDIKHTNGSILSPMDRYPQILRNICAGVCVWLQSREASGSMHRNGVQSNNAWLHGTDVGPRYVDIREELRVAVASATSHHDTARILATLSVDSDTAGGLNDTQLQS